MNISTKNRKMLTPINIDVFKRYVSDRTNDNEINNSYKKFKIFLDSEEKDVEILNNAFSEFGSLNNLNQTRLKKSRHSTKKMALNYPLFKLISKDVNSKSHIKINPNLFVKKTKINKNNKNNKNKTIIKTSNIINTNNSNDKDNNRNKKYYNTFTSNHKFPNLKLNKKELINYKNQVNTTSNKFLNNKEYSNPKINNIDIKKSNESLDKNIITRNNYLNKTSGLFNNINKSKKILNFMEFYNINKNKKEPENESNIGNMNSISYKTMNNIYQINPDKNKLFFDIEEIKDINSNLNTKIEKSEIKQNLKSKKFNKKYKRNETKFFGNEDIKVIKNIKKKNKKKSFDYFRQSQKGMKYAQKVIGNNYKREKTVSEEINLRKQKEKNFYDLIDNIILNNNLFVYDINKIDKRLRLKQEDDF